MPHPPSGIRRHVRLGACLLAWVGLAACAVTEPATRAARDRTYAPYLDDPRVAVNLTINREAKADLESEPALKHLYEQLEDSGAFARLDLGSTRWPITLEVRYSQTPKNKTAFIAAAVACGLTLGLAPINVVEIHTLTVDIVHKTKRLKRLEYRETIENRLSLYDGLMNPHRAEQAAIDRLLPAFLADLKTQRLIPSMREIRTAPRGIEV